MHTTIWTLKMQATKRNFVLITKEWISSFYIYSLFYLFCTISNNYQTAINRNVLAVNLKLNCTKMLIILKIKCVRCD
jgi:hypothetical protein